MSTDELAVPLPRLRAGDSTDNPQEHVEIVLDDEPEGPPEMVSYESVEEAEAAQRRPIIPEKLRKGQIGNATKQLVGGSTHTSIYHAVRSPWYLLQASFWAPFGLFKILQKLHSWVYTTEITPTRQAAANNRDYRTWDHATTSQKEAAPIRLIAVGLGALALAALGFYIRMQPPPAWAVTGLTTLGLLGHIGRPDEHPIVHHAVIAPRFRKISQDVVLRAYYAAGLGKPDKPGQEVGFGPGGMKEIDGGTGVEATINLGIESGYGFDDAVKAKPKLASGLDVATTQLFLTRDKASERSHRLYIAKKDMLAEAAGRTPLVKLKPTDIWKPIPLGLDERGKPVSIAMIWEAMSILIGSQTRKGKTFAARLLALYAALDPYVKLTVTDGKAAPDWRKFSLVADRFVFGKKMTREGDPVDILIDTLQEIKDDCEERYERLSQLPVDVCPEGKLTRALARDKHFNMPVRFVVMEEFQEYLEIADTKKSKEIAALLMYLVKVAPAAGVIVASSTQKPSGIGGAGETGRLFLAYRDSHVARFALKCGNWRVSEAILGDGHTEEYDAANLPMGPEYKGVGILYGDTEYTRMVRTYLADGQDAERILIAARAMRESAGTLTGMAAGDTVDVRSGREVLADALSMYLPGEQWVSWDQLAERMKEKLPEFYDGMTKDAISPRLRGLGVPSVKGREKVGLNRVLQGARAADVNQAMARRAVSND